MVFDLALAISALLMDSFLIEAFSVVASDACVPVDGSVSSTCSTTDASDRVTVAVVEEVFVDMAELECIRAEPATDRASAVDGRAFGCIHNCSE